MEEARKCCDQHLSRHENVSVARDGLFDGDAWLGEKMG